MGSKRYIYTGREFHYSTRFTMKGNPGGFQEVLGESSIIPLDVLGKGNPGGFQEVLGESSTIPLDSVGKGTQVGSKRYWERVPLFH